MNATETLQKKNGFQINFSINIQLPDMNPSAVSEAKKKRKKLEDDEMTFRPRYIPMAG